MTRYAVSKSWLHSLSTASSVLGSSPIGQLGQLHSCVGCVSAIQLLDIHVLDQTRWTGVRERLQCLLDAQSTSLHEVGHDQIARAVQAVGAVHRNVARGLRSDELVYDANELFNLRLSRWRLEAFDAQLDVLDAGLPKRDLAVVVLGRVGQVNQQTHIVTVSGLRVQEDLRCPQLIGRADHSRELVVQRHAHGHEPRRPDQRANLWHVVPVVRHRQLRAARAASTATASASSACPWPCCWCWRRRLVALLAVLLVVRQLLSRLHVAVGWSGRSGTGPRSGSGSGPGPAAGVVARSGA